MIAGLFVFSLSGMDHAAVAAPDSQALVLRRTRILGPWPLKDFLSARRFLQPRFHFAGFHFAGAAGMLLARSRYARRGPPEGVARVDRLG
jgi:hypothetical protein